MGATSRWVLLAVLGTVALVGLLWLGQPRPGPSPGVAAPDAPAERPPVPAAPSPDAAPRPLVVGEPAPPPADAATSPAEGIFADDASAEPLRFTDDDVAALERALEGRGLPRPDYIACEPTTCEMGWELHLGDDQLVEAQDVLSAWDLPFVFTPYRRPADPSVMSWFRRRLTRDEAKAAFEALGEQSDDVAGDIDAGD